MSRRQLTTKERDQIDRQRLLNRERSEQHKAELDRQKLELDLLRRQSQEKLSQVVKLKQPARQLVSLSRSQWLVLCCVAAALLLGGLNLASRQGPISTAVTNSLVIRGINGQRREYRVGSNRFFEGWTLETVPQLFRVTNSAGLPLCPEEPAVALPVRHNSRAKLAACRAPIRDQGNCTGSFAQAVAGMMRDRYCLATGGKRRFDASAQHLLTCLSRDGCEGGDLADAARHAAAVGLVNTVCAPSDSERSAACDQELLKSCPRLRFAAVCTLSDATQIKRQILKHGPVASLLHPSLELLLYKSGDFSADKARPLPGAHAVKLVGWDTDKAGREVWLVENSWGESWGLQGLARIRQGSDPLLEQNVVVGIVEKELTSPL